ncbi:PCI domain containing protein [Acanthamoeba castellanii str. Neff]|uniref:PCI domain containing protein n=1 Tax=Acanthamoeba castellanii (strain ATCC 30010 / Neff) TaxID=1257118 RepID=L8GQR2_ACACF|nr:PCI domain containing protein [Acanthamoeba castellanii str. Neff]ELR14471.1 PCI domain containing protein [Acanthamoeba castellanii str. Neff]
MTSLSGYDAFLELAKRADESKNYEAAIPQLNKLPELLKHWSATKEQSRTLYLLAYRIFSGAHRQVEAYESLVRHLAMTEEASGEDTSALAVQAAVEAIRLPQVVQLDGLLGLPAIQQLATSQPQLFALLKIFAEDSLSAYTQFHQSHPGFLESVGLTHEECLRKQRVLALAGLASGREELSYAQVAQELGVEEGEVEAWVIEAVGAGVVDARLDQTRRVVLVNHVTLRTFTAEHWQQMSSRLALWKDNLVSLLEVVQQNKKLAA